MTGLQLPKFREPPLIEVALSVQYEPLQRLVVPEIGLLWQHYGEKFSRVEQHPPIDPVIERFGVKNVAKGPPTIKFETGIPLPRIWFVDDSSEELLQIQQDRFVRNWRKGSSGEGIYPHYEEHIRPKFVTDYEDFKEFLRDNDIGEVCPNQCEVVYINIIPANDLWSKHSEIGKLFTCLSDEYFSNSIYRVEIANFSSKYLIEDEEKIIGRLHLTIQPEYSNVDDTPAFRMTIVARGAPASQGLDGVMKFMDVGREHIVRLFDEVTTPELHEIWGKLE